MDNQQLKARFFGMHVGCPFVAYGEQNVVDVGNFEYCLSDEDCKLVLRPLSSITDKEVFEAFNSAGLYGLEVFRDEDKIGIVGRNGVSAVIWIKTSPSPIGAFLEAWNNIPGKSQPECFEYMLVDYLRSIGICLPFMGIDPIEAGWAVLSE